MEMIGNIKAYTWEDILEKYYGTEGSPERLAYEKDIAMMYKRREAGLKAAQTRKRKKEEALRLAKEQEETTKIAKEKEEKLRSTIQIIVKKEHDRRSNSFDQIPIELIENLEKTQAISLGR